MMQEWMHKMRVTRNRKYHSVLENKISRFNLIYKYREYNPFIYQKHEKNVAELLCFMTYQVPCKINAMMEYQKIYSGYEDLEKY